MSENLMLLALVVFWIIPMVLIAINDSRGHTDDPNIGRDPKRY